MTKTDRRLRYAAIAIGSCVFALVVPLLPIEWSDGRGNNLAMLLALLILAACLFVLTYFILGLVYVEFKKVYVVFEETTANLKISKSKRPHIKRVGLDLVMTECRDIWRATTPTGRRIIVGLIPVLIWVLLLLPWIQSGSSSRFAWIDIFLIDFCMKSAALSWTFHLIDKGFSKLEEAEARRAFWNKINSQRAGRGKADNEQAKEAKPDQSKDEQEQGHEQHHDREHSYESDTREVPSQDWCYRLLGITSEATLEEINRAYRRKARMHHPDHKGDGDVMRMLNEAVQVLRESRTAKN